MIEAPAAFLCNYPVSLLGLKLLPYKSATSLLSRKSQTQTCLAAAGTIPHKDKNDFPWLLGYTAGYPSPD